MTEKQFDIRPLHSLGEMHGAVDLQRTYWGDDDSALIPAHMLFSIAANGGHVLAAMDGDTMAGVVVGFLGMNPKIPASPTSNLHVYSKRMIVSRDYRNHGVGARLKFAQRDYALEHGVQLVVWTFDPLLSINAHLNLRKLGVVSRSFREDYYGTDNTGGLSSMGYSDRLYVEWWLENERVERCAQGQYERRSLEQYREEGAVIVNPADVGEDGFRIPSSEIDKSLPDVCLVEIPVNYYEMIDSKPDLVTWWRSHNRKSLGWLLLCGYKVVDFVTTRERAFYVLVTDGNETT